MYVLREGERAREIEGEKERERMREKEMNVAFIVFRRRRPRRLVVVF